MIKSINKFIKIVRLNKLDKRMIIHYKNLDELQKIEEIIYENNKLEDLQKEISLNEINDIRRDN
tara:strand:+ start:181 stop:372 length:192 start_codon:yes stop_codon:yes gene_type:complete